MDHRYLIKPQLVYIHWPFVSLRSSKKLMSFYGSALNNEIASFSQYHNQKADLKVLYIGGGTLNRVPEAEILDMSGTLRKTFNLENLLQGTIEVNQVFFNDAQLNAWQKLGINRLVIEIHHYMQPEPSFDRIRDFFSIIAVACTICITPETMMYWKIYIKKIILWPIKQISISFVPTVYQSLRVDFYYWLREFLLRNGMRQYEVYGFEIPNHGSAYMKGYLARETMIGFGVYAESFDGIVRYRNEKNLTRYIQKINQKKSPVMSKDVLTKKSAYIEKIMLGLRLQKGISKNLLYADYSEKECLILDEQLEALKRNKLITESGDRVILTPEGLGHEQNILLKLVV